MSERHPPVIDERTYQRRRLAVLAGLLAIVLGVAPFVGSTGGAPGAVQVGGEVVRAASVGSPTAVRELLSDTTTTLVEATGATTATTAVPTTTTGAPTTATTDARSDDEPTADEPVTDEPVAAAEPDPEPDGTAAIADPEPDGSEPVAREDADPPARETTTTRAPAPTTTSAPPTTRAPAPTTTTTTPPAPQGDDGEREAYAYDDPRSTQVWYDLAECESGGNWSIDTGNGYYGGLQFSLATWESVGGTGYPHEHPPAVQIERGRQLQARQGWGAWPHCSKELGLR